MTWPRSRARPSCPSSGPRSPPRTSPAAESSTRSRRLTVRAVKLTRYGYDCYAYCMLAAGHLDLVVESGLKSYDIVPLIPIIEGAGGIVTSWDGGSAAGGGRIVAAGDRR